MFEAKTREVEIAKIMSNVLHSSQTEALLADDIDRSSNIEIIFDLNIILTNSDLSDPVVLFFIFFTWKFRAAMFLSK